MTNLSYEPRREPAGPFATPTTQPSAQSGLGRLVVAVSHTEQRNRPSEEELVEGLETKSKKLLSAHLILSLAAVDRR